MSFENEKEPPLASTEKRERFEGDHWVLESELSSGGEIADAVVARLAERGWSEDEIGNFHLVVKEIADNAVIHGNWGIQRKDYPTEDAYHAAIQERGKTKGGEEKNVTVDIHFFDDGENVDVTISDEGTGFSPEDIPDPTLGEGITKSSGRGWFLMNALASAELSVGKGEVVLHWKKNRDSEGYRSIKEGPHHEI